VKAAFPLADFFQTYLLEGLDDIALTMRHEPDIAAYETRRPVWAPRIKVPSGD
jgi:3-isopropylmalate/(R)-2-methylmalate dehydratase small subunit